MKKINRIWIYPLFFVGILTNSCSKDDALAPIPPVLTTSAVTDITQTTAISGGNVISDGGSAITARGVCWSLNTTPTIADNKITNGAGLGSFTSSLSSLTSDTAYYVRAYATNSGGTGYGSIISFKTLPLPIPELATSMVTDISQTTAISGGNVSSDGGSTVTARGVCWSTGTTPTIADSKTTDGTGTGSFASSITNLIANTKYSVRAYATNSTGTGYGSAMSFTTQPVKDIDGNVYHTVTIGSQVWMVENLKVTKYNDSTAVQLVTDNTAWQNLTTASYCWYNNDEATYKNTYGALYNWYAVNTDKLCPTGWHVPTDAEWTILTTYLGGESVAGEKLKEIGFGHWLGPDQGATDESGFKGLPGGARFYDGTPFYNLGGFGYWWSSSESGIDGSALLLNGGDGSVLRWGPLKGMGLSVRCLRD